MSRDGNTRLRAALDLRKQRCSSQACAPQFTCRFSGWFCEFRVSAAVSQNQVSRVTPLEDVGFLVVPLQTAVYSARSLWELRGDGVPRCRRQEPALGRAAPVGPAGASAAGQRTQLLLPGSFCSRHQAAFYICCPTGVQVCRRFWTQVGFRTQLTPEILFALEQTERTEPRARKWPYDLSGTCYV